MHISVKNIFVFCALVGVVASCSNSVYAHGGGFQLSKRANASPYSVTIGTIPDPPTVGEAIFILEVTKLGDSDRVVDLSVTVVPSGPVGTDENPATVYGEPDSYDPTLYETRVELPNPGSWTFDVTIDGQDGRGEAQFTYDVKQVSPIGGIITLLALLAFLAIIGLSMRAFLKERNRGAKTRRRNT